MRQSPSNPSTVRAGGAYVELTLRDKVTTGMHAVERKLARFSARMNNVANRMLATGAMFATPFIAATVAYAGFEKQMAEVSTMLDEPQQHMQKFSNTVLDMSREFGDSTQNIARGLYDILSAAIAPADALSVLSVSAKAAVGGLTDTATAVDAVTTVLNSFGMDASEASDVADVLFTTVKRGKLQFNDLAQFIGKTTSFAALAGVELTELGAILATTTRAGLQPEIAVTATRQFIGSIIRPTKESAKLFSEIFGEEMNTQILQTWGGVLGFITRISKLDTETQGTLCPKVRAAAAALTLTANTEGLEEDLGFMMNRTGAAEEAFNKMAGTTAYAWNKLKQSVVSVFTTIGEAIGPMVSNAADAMGVVIESILPWIKANGALFVSLAGIVASILGLGAALKVAAFAISGFSIVLKILMITMSVFTAAWVTLKAIILGTMAVFTGFNAITIAGLAATLTLVIGLISVFGEGLANSFKKAKHDAGEMVEGITAALQTGNIKLAAEILSAGVELVFTEMMKGISNAWTTWTHELAKKLMDFWVEVQKINVNVGEWWDGFMRGVDKTWSYVEEGAEIIFTAPLDEFDNILRMGPFGAGDPEIFAYYEKYRRQVDQGGEDVAAAAEKERDRIEQLGKDTNAELTRQLEAEIRTRQANIDKKRKKLKKLTAQAKADWEEYQAENKSGQDGLKLPALDDLMLGIGQGQDKLTAAADGVRGAINYAAAVRLGLEAGSSPFENLEERNTRANEQVAQTLNGVKRLLESNLIGD